MADTRWTRCDWHPEHIDDRPAGSRCGAPATHRIVWLDGSGRASYGCDAHLQFDPEAPPHRIERIERGAPPIMELRPKTCPQCGREAWFSYWDAKEARRASPLCWGYTEQECPGYRAWRSRELRRAARALRRVRRRSRKARRGWA